MDATVHYADVGIRTRTGACWFAAFMVVNAVIVLGLRSHDLVRAATASFFLVMVLLSTSVHCASLAGWRDSTPLPPMR